MTTTESNTPYLTDHARERCAEMGLRTKTVKRVIQYPDFTYPGRVSAYGQTTISVRGMIAVVHVGNRAITVLWHRLNSRGEGNELHTGKDVLRLVSRHRRQRGASHLFGTMNHDR